MKHNKTVSVSMVVQALEIIWKFPFNPNSIIEFAEFWFWFKGDEVKQKFQRCLGQFLWSKRQRCVIVLFYNSSKYVNID